MAKDNKSLGRFNLDGIMPSPRGVPQIEVSFSIDANGILSVSAKDKATGKENSIRITGSTQLSKEEVERMKKEAEVNAEADRLEKEKIEKLNLADSTIFQTEKQIKEFGDKLSETDKTNLNNVLTELKDAHKNSEISKIDELISKLNETWSVISTELYKNAQSQGATDDTSSTENVEDTSYEEVS